MHKGNFEQVEKLHQVELVNLEKDYKENKDKVIEYIIENSMRVTWSCSTSNGETDKFELVLYLYHI